jgi:hypothetical protein
MNAIQCFMHIKQFVHIMYTTREGVNIMRVKLPAFDQIEAKALARNINYAFNFTL